MLLLGFDKINKLIGKIDNLVLRGAVKQSFVNTLNNIGRDFLGNDSNKDEVNKQTHEDQIRKKYNDVTKRIADKLANDNDVQNVFSGLSKSDSKFF